MNFDFRKRPLDLLCSNVKGGARSKSGGNRFWCLDSCALPFAFSCLLLSLLPLCLFRLPPFPDPAPPASAHRFCRPPELFSFLLLSLFLPFSRCIKIEFPELKAPPSRLNITGLGTFLLARYFAPGNPEAYRSQGWFSDFRSYVARNPVRVDLPLDKSSTLRTPWGFRFSGLIFQCFDSQGRTFFTTF